MTDNYSKDISNKINVRLNQFLLLYLRNGKTGSADDKIDINELAILQSNFHPLSSINNPTADFILRFSKDNFLIIASNKTTPELGLGQTTDLRYFCDSLMKIYNSQIQIPRNAVNKAMSSRTASWNEYLKSGYSMYPWEAFTNSSIYGDSLDLQPPHWQVVLLHPEIAVGTHFGSAAQTRLDESVLINAFGIIHYFDTDENYLGISCATSISEQRGIGVGFTGHIGYGSLRALDIAIMFEQPTNSNCGYFRGYKGPPSVLIGLDILKLIQSATKN